MGDGESDVFTCVRNTVVNRPRIPGNSANRDDLYRGSVRRGPFGPSKIENLLI